MRELATLEAALARANALAAARVTDAPAGPMAQVAVNISRLLSPEGSTAGVPSFGERELEALSAFRDRTREPDFRTLRLACSACTHAIPEDGYVLLADPGALDGLLGAVDRHAGEPRWFRRLFDILRKTYLNANREADWFTRTDVGRGNERLRQFLERNFARVVKIEPVLDWVRTLSEYPEILSTEPGRRFARDLLAGDWQGLETTCRGLGITGGSWLVREAVRSAKDVAVGTADHEAFKLHISALLGLASEQRFAPLRDEIYAALVTRYADIPARPVHPELRDALIAAWKNPWLVRNDSAWGLVSPEARKMVAGWLKLDLLRQFFDVLSEDRGQDRSRFEFWSRHHEQMDDVYIALGPNAYYSQRPDLVRLRHALDGRLLQLKSPGADTHAFIMFMGDDVVVEFSQNGNAAYRYRRTCAPVHDALRTATIRLLKNQDRGTRMLHKGAHGLTWQQRFAQALGFDQDWRPATTHRLSTGTARLGPVDRLAWREQPSVHNPGRGSGRPTSPTDADVHTLPGEVAAFARRHNLRLEDHRHDGGYLWVHGGDARPEISRQMKAWGFAYRPGRGWWRKR
jgi:hypothetical protein